MKAYLVVFLLGLFLFTFRLLHVPPGIETDEGTIAHNAALIAKTGRDQNGRFLPVFILSSDKIDWKQPVLIYLSAITFKIFGPSLLTFKLVNVSLSLMTLLLMGALLKQLFGAKTALVGLLVAVATPMIIIASRLGNEGIDPFFFATLWLLAIVWYRKTARPRWLALAALALGIGFYSYKGMRLIVPPWTLLTAGYIYLSRAKKYISKSVLEFIKQSLKDKQLWRDIAVFGLVLLPFFLVTPILESKYAGSIFDRTTISWESYRHYAYFWLANLDPSFQYTVGDIGKIFSVDRFGMFLLSMLPFFLMGIKKAMEKLSFFTFILIAYLFTPSLFGLAGSVGYGHRLIAIIPLYVIITTLGIQATFETLLRFTTHAYPVVRVAVKILGVSLAAFSLFSFLDFCAYYYFYYPTQNTTHDAFPNDLDPAFYKLAHKSKQAHLTPYVQDTIYYSHGEGIQFFEVAYFNQPLKIWKLGNPLPQGSVLLTQVDQLAEAKDSGIPILPWHILESN